MTLRGSIAVVGQLFGNLQLVGETMIDLIGPLRVYRGDSVTYRLTVTDDADEREDLTGADITVEIKANLDGADPALVSLAVGSGVTLLTQSGDTLGQADVQITGSDTDRPSQLYWLDVVVELSGERTHVIAPREFTIAPVVNGP